MAPANQSVGETGELNWPRLHLPVVGCGFPCDAQKIVLRVRNYHHISVSYGELAARFVMLDLQRRVEGLFSGIDQARATPFFGQGVGSGCLRSNAVGSLGGLCRDWLQAIYGAIVFQPFDVPQGFVHLAIDIEWLQVTDEGAVPGNPPCRGFGMPFFGESARGDSSWASRYRADMALVAGLLAYIDAAHVFEGGDASDGPPIFWQAVRCVQDDDRVLYHEAQLGEVAANGLRRPFAEELVAAERLGLARQIDYLVMRSVIRELVADDAAVLGVNISALSLSWDFLWDEIEWQLAGCPEIATRLVFEITETAAIPDIAEAIRVVERLHRLGCRVAVEDFGAGFASVRQLLALSPDIAKIDGLFVRRAGRSEKDRSLFAHLIGVAQAICGTVVVEGVETAEQSALACSCGAEWQQGHFLGDPAFYRSRVIPSLRSSWEGDWQPLIIEGLRDDISGF